ncbi:MAG: DUF5678 domain-containing protein [Candidatus Thermoplasmatota archaeon]|jgi:dihydroxyacetone kinase-like predicted kinase|nr:DUF5678 domain-containing protein [Candidatus Thermoplasmatota archaeon]
MSELLLSKEIKKLRKFNNDLDWFMANYEKLKEEYKSQYVAVKDQKIIDHDEKVEELFKRLKGKYGNISSLVVEYVSGEKVEYIL